MAGRPGATLGPIWGHSIDRETGTGAKLDKTPPKFPILEFSTDGRREPGNRNAKCKLKNEKSKAMDCCRSAACRTQEETLQFNIIPTEFVFFKASPDESTVGVVLSLPAGTMGDGAECDRHPATLHYAG